VKIVVDGTNYQTELNLNGTAEEIDWDLANIWFGK
jgi:hypothetical protein